MISAQTLFFHWITSFFRLETDVFTCLYRTELVPRNLTNSLLPLLPARSGTPGAELLSQSSLRQSHLSSPGSQEAGAGKTARLSRQLQ